MAQVIINIDDVNKTPFFEISSYTHRIPDTQPLGRIGLRLSAVDRDMQVCAFYIAIWGLLDTIFSEEFSCNTFHLYIFLSGCCLTNFPQLCDFHHLDIFISHKYYVTGHPILLFIGVEWLMIIKLLFDHQIAVMLQKWCPSIKLQSFIVLTVCLLQGTMRYEVVLPDPAARFFGIDNTGQLLLQQSVLNEQPLQYEVSLYPQGTALLPYIFHLIYIYCLSKCG